MELMVIRGLGHKNGKTKKKLLTDFSLLCMIGNNYIDIIFGKGKYHAELKYDFTFAYEHDYGYDSL